MRPAKIVQEGVEGYLKVRILKIKEIYNLERDLKIATNELQHLAYTFSIDLKVGS